MMWILLVRLNQLTGQSGDTGRIQTGRNTQAQSYKTFFLMKIIEWTRTGMSRRTEATSWVLVWRSWLYTNCTMRAVCLVYGCLGLPQSCISGFYNSQRRETISLKWASMGCQYGPSGKERVETNERRTELSVRRCFERFWNIVVHGPRWNINDSSLYGKVWWCKGVGNI